MSDDFPLPPPLVNAELRQQLEADVAARIDEFRTRIAALNAIIDSTANGSINANAAPYVKGLAREVVALARQTIRLAMLAAGAFDDADTGVDPET